MDALRTNWLAIFVLWLSGLGAAAQYGKISVTYSNLSAFYDGAGARIGFLVSLIGVVGILFGVVAGVIVARIGFRRTLIAALFFGALISFFQAFLPSFGLLAASRVLEGLSHLAIVVAAPTLIAQLSKDSHRGFTLTLWSTFFGVSFALLTWVGIPFVDANGLGALFSAHGVYMALCAIAVIVVLAPDAPKSDAPKSEIRPLTFSSVLSDHRRIYSSPNLSAPALGWLFYTFCFVSILTLLPPFLDPSIRVIVMGVLPLISIAASMTLGVALVHWLRSVRVVQIGFITGALCLCGFWLLPLPILWCFGFAGAMGLVQSASFSAVAELNPTVEARAQANGAMAQMGNLGNGLGTPVIAAFIISMGTPGLVLPIVVALSLGALTHWVLARRA